MLEQLFKTLVSQGQKAVVENPAIPNELNQKVIGEAGGSIFSSLQGMLAGGGLTQVLNMFTTGAKQSANPSGMAGMLANPIVQQMVQSFIGKITSQYNLSPAVATQVGNLLIPQVLQAISSKVADPNDPSIDMNGIMQSLTGGQAGGLDFGQLAGKLAAVGDVDGDGDVDFQDIIASMAGAAKTQQQATPTNTFMDLVGRFMK